MVYVNTPHKMADDACAWVSRGYKYLKPKLSGDLRSDIDRVMVIRDAIGKNVDIHLDANYGYRHFADVLRLDDAVTALNVSILEDPLMGGLEEMTRLRERMQTRLMLDNQASWPNIKHVVARRAAHIVNQHANKQGGMDTAVAIAGEAARGGIDSAVGSGGGFGIQSAAFIQLASVIGLTRPCEHIPPEEYYQVGLRGASRFGADPSVLRSRYSVENGEISLPDASGLGTDIDMEKLQAISISKWSLAA